MAIPFIPLDDLEKVFDQLYDVVPEESVKLWEYFDEIYLRGRAARGRRKHVPPRFPTETWNLFDAVINRVDRTNNIVESWHNKFQRMVAAHSSVWKFLEAVKNDQHDNSKLFAQLAAGHIKIRHPIRKIYKTNQDYIEVMVANYEHYKNQKKNDAYLQGISYRLKIHPIQGVEIEEDDEDLSD